MTKEESLFWVGMDKDKAEGVPCWFCGESLHGHRRHGERVRPNGNRPSRYIAENCAACGELAKDASGVHKPAECPNGGTTEKCVLWRTRKGLPLKYEAPKGSTWAPVGPCRTMMVSGDDF